MLPTFYRTEHLQSTFHLAPHQAQHPNVSHLAHRPPSTILTFLFSTATGFQLARDSRSRPPPRDQYIAAQARPSLLVFPMFSTYNRGSLLTLLDGQTIMPPHLPEASPPVRPTTDVLGIDIGSGPHIIFAKKSATWRTWLHGKDVPNARGS